MTGFTRRQIVQRGAAGLCLVNTPIRSLAAGPDVAAALDWHDRAVHVLDTWLRDPFITRARDGYFYLTGTTMAPQSQAFRKGVTTPSGWFVRCWRSRDLAHWQPIGEIASIEDAASYRAERAVFDHHPQDKWRVWAPEIHQREDGRWGMVFTAPPPLRPRVEAALMLSAGADLKGPWRNPMGAAVGLRHDPSLFRDDDGAWWMIWGNTAIAPLEPDWSGYVGAPIRVHPADAAALGHEGSTLLRIGGRYVLFGTGWSTSKWRKGSYNLYCATADRITGPYGKRKLVGRFLGHGTPFQDGRGRWWCTAFPNANRPALPAAGIEHRDLGDDALTINPQGLTLVPLSVERVDGDVEIRAIDPHYALAGPDEAPTWAGKIEIGQGNI
jgi:arylsulfatase